MNKLIRPLTAESLGTALFVFVGAGSVVANSGASSPSGILGIAAAHGLALGILVTAMMRISGAHFNPAVTLALLTAGKTDRNTAGFYIAAQLVGAIVGALLIKALYPPGPAAVTSLGAPALANNLTFAQGVMVEAVLTFFLVSAVFGTAVSSESPAVGGFGIGLAAMVTILAGGPLTGGAVNPARALGPALVSGFGPAPMAGELEAQAIYWIGPILGAVAAALVWKLVLLPKDPARI